MHTPISLPTRSAASGKRAGSTWLLPIRFLLPSAGLFFALGSAGCRPCDDLDARLCTDLGSKDCAVWQNELDRRGSPSVLEGSSSTGRNMLKGRGLVKDILYGENGELCGRVDATAYSAVLAGVRLEVSAHQKRTAGP